MNLIKTFVVLTLLICTHALRAQDTKVVDGKTFKVHKIGRGETLSKIANRYDISLSELKTANKGLTDNIQAGQELLIPVSGAAQISDEKGVHTVQKGETVSLIASKYGISQADLKKWNNLRNNNINLGQKLIVSAPTSKPTEPALQPAIQPQKSEPTENQGQTHTVGKGETFYALARKYNVSAADLKKANNLTNLNLKEGQVLVIPGSAKLISAPTPVKPTPTPPPPPSIAPSPTAPGKPTEPEKPQQAEAPKKEVAVEQLPDASGEPGRTVTNTLGYERVLETGLAEFIDNNIDSQKHLCLHKTAPIGSIIQVKNELNGAVIFVKVIGKLPDTGNNDRLIIKISKRAYEKLGATGKRFPVEVSYPSPL